MASQPEIEAAAWYFCPHIPGLHQAGPNNVCDRTCGDCRVRAAAALEAAGRVRVGKMQQELNVVVARMKASKAADLCGND